MSLRGPVSKQWNCLLKWDDAHRCRVQHRLFSFTSSGNTLGSAVRSETQAYVSGLKHINKPKRFSTGFPQVDPRGRRETRLAEGAGQTSGSGCMNHSACRRLRPWINSVVLRVVCGGFAAVALWSCSLDRGRSEQNKVRR